MGDFKVTEPGKGGVLTMDGSLTVENASEIRSRLIKTLVKEDQVEVRIGPYASIDVSFLQLLCSAHFTASKLGKSFSIIPMSGAGFFRAVENAGYARSRGCARGTNGACLWVRGEHD